MDWEMTATEAIEGVLVMSSELTMPDPELDVSGFILTPMELGIKSVRRSSRTW